MLAAVQQRKPDPDRIRNTFSTVIEPMTTATTEQRDIEHHQSASTTMT
jgi:hypothetical protein